MDSWGMGTYAAQISLPLWTSSQDVDCVWRMWYVDRGTHMCLRLKQTHQDHMQMTWQLRLIQVDCQSQHEIN